MEVLKESLKSIFEKFDQVVVVEMDKWTEISNNKKESNVGENPKSKE